MKYEVYSGIYAQTYIYIFIYKISFNPNIIEKQSVTNKLYRLYK